MKDDNVIRISICPLCGQSYHERPAISRTDNKTPICPDCGTRQALETIGVFGEEQDEILKSIHGIHHK